MRAVGLLWKLLVVLDACRADVVTRGQQLAIAEDGRERVIQLMRYARNQLADGGHLLALNQLFLRPAEIFIGLPRLLVQERFLDGGGKLRAGRGQQVQIGGGEFDERPASHHQASQDAAPGPQEHPPSYLNSPLFVAIPEDRWKRQTL